MSAMKIIDCFEPKPVAAGTEVLIPEAVGCAASSDELVPSEHMVDIVVDGVKAFTLNCTPEYLAELAIGRLYSERIIASTDDIERLHVCKDGSVIKVELVAGSVRVEPLGEVTISSCNAAREAHVARFDDEVMPPVAVRGVNPNWVGALAKEFSADTPLHKKTRGVHSCFVAYRDTFEFFCEDIGRHNAFDKTVGWALRYRKDLTERIMLTSGRIPRDMAAKAIRAGVATLLSASVPTAQALELARDKNLTVIGKVGAKGYHVFYDAANSFSQPTVSDLRILAS